MISVTIKTETARKNLAALSAKFPGFLDTAAKSTAFFGIRRLMQRTPRKTGHARRGWGQPTSYAKNAYLIHNEVPYIGYLNEGTKAHIISPRIKKALFWRKWPGAPIPPNSTGKYKGWIFAGVNHPGTKGLFFVEQSIADMRIYLNQNVEQKLKALINNPQGVAA